MECNLADPWCLKGSTLPNNIALPHLFAPPSPINITAITGNHT